MKKLLLSIAFILLLSTKAFAIITQLTPADAFIDVHNPTTNSHTSGSYGLRDNDAYLMHYDLSSYAGKYLTYAHVYIYSDRAAGDTFYFYRLLQTFNNTQVTWNQYSTGNNWGTAGALGLNVDYTTQNSVTTGIGEGQYLEYDVTKLARDAAAAGTNLDIAFRSNSATPYDTIHSSADSTHPTYMIIDFNPTSTTPNNWYVNDAGPAWGFTSTTCNGSSATVFNGSNGPNCASGSPQPYLASSGQNPPIMAGGDILNIAGDSTNTWRFTLSGATNRPAVGDTFTTGGVTYTVTVTLPAGQTSGTISMTGASSPASSGTLTNATCAGTFGSCTTPLTYTAIAVAQAQYPINTGLQVPGGTANDYTIVQGTGTQYAQFYVTSNPGALLNAYLGDLIVKNIDLTVHDSCVANGPGSGTNADGYLYHCGGGSVNGTTGVLWGGLNVYLQNMLVHGFGNGMNNNINGDQIGGIVGNVYLINTKVFGNSAQGAMIGNSQPIDNTMTGTIYYIDTQVQYSGCGARYPMQDSADVFKDVHMSDYSSSVDNPANFYSCFGQNNGGYGDGTGFGANSAYPGNWVFIHTSASWNVQDGVDTLHGRISKSNAIIMLRGRFEGNGGQQIKLNGGHYEIVESNFIGGDCQFWLGPISPRYPGDMGMGDTCRAQGDTTALIAGPGTQIYILGNTVDTNGITFSPAGSSCDSTTGLYIYNNIVNCGSYSSHDGSIGGVGDAQQATFIYYGGVDGNGTGSCSSWAVANVSGVLSAPANQTYYLDKSTYQIYQVVSDTVNTNTGSGMLSLGAFNTNSYPVSGMTVTPTVGAVYTSNGTNILYVTSASSSNITVATLNGGPPCCGTLTKVSGTGDASIPFGSCYSNCANNYGGEGLPNNGGAGVLALISSSGQLISGPPQQNIGYSSVSWSGRFPVHEDYNVVYNCKNSNSPCGGAHDQCGVNPGLVSTYSTGTVSISNGSSTLTGTGTNWSNIPVGDGVLFGSSLNPSSNGTWYTVQSVNSSTSITLTANYTGTTLTNSAYLLAIPMGAPAGNGISTYYTGINESRMSYLVSGSPSVAAGTASMNSYYLRGTNDANNYRQSSPPDLGCYQLSTTFTPTTYMYGSCTTNNECDTGVCYANTCAADPVVIPTGQSFKGALRGNLGR